MSLDYAVAYRESEAGALRAFGCKERIENLLPDVFRHSCSVVSKPQTQAATFAFAANCQPSSGGHCIHGVHDQVNENLSQLRGTPESNLAAFRLQNNLIIQAAKSRLVLPARACDFNRIIQQT